MIDLRRKERKGSKKFEEIKKGREYEKKEK